MPFFVVNPDIVYRPEGRDGAILFDPDTSRVEAVNLTGAFVWERLDGKRSLDGICEDLAARFEEPPPIVELLDHVRGFVETLRGIGFVAMLEDR